MALLKWWLVVTTMTVASVFAYVFGVFDSIWANDPSRLSWVIMGILAVGTTWCGFQCARLDRARRIKKNSRINEYEGNLIGAEVQTWMNTGWFVASLCPVLGFIGTVLGFMDIGAAFASVNIVDAEAGKQAIAGLSAGMSTALYTTGVGLACAPLLQLQLTIIERTINRMLYGVQQ